MAREPDIEIVDLFRVQWTNPNTTLNGTAEKGVYPEYPELQLDNSQYPQVSVIPTNKPGRPIGIGSNTIHHDWTAQIGVWVKEPMRNADIIDIAGVKYTEDKLIDKIINDLRDILVANWKTGLASSYNDLEFMSEGELLFDEERQAYLRFFTVRLPYFE